MYGAVWIAAAIQVAAGSPGATDPAALMARYRNMTSVTSTDSAGCANRRAADPDEILVCKGRDSALRLPLPDERGPPDGPRRPTGDLTTRVPGAPCPPGGCTGINLLAVPKVLVQIVQKVIDPDR